MPTGNNKIKSASYFAWADTVLETMLGAGEFPADPGYLKETAFG
jgi:hypothetical protein